MSDAGKRAALEAAQAECKRLHSVINGWASETPEREGLRREVAELEQAVSSHEARRIELDLLERNTRTSLDERVRANQNARGRWWMSQLTPVAVVASVCLAWRLAFEAIEYINWPLWADRIGVALLFIPSIVNGSRLGAAVLRARRRSSQLVDSTAK